MTRLLFSIAAWLFALLLVFPVANSPAAGASDSTPPVLQSLTYPTSIDTGSSSAVLPVTMVATDDMSGLGYNWGYIRWKSPDGNAFTYGFASENETVADVYFPQYSAAGAWHIDFMLLKDKAGNQVRFVENDLISGGFSTTVQVVSTSVTTSTTTTSSTTTTLPPTTTTSLPPSTTTTTAPPPPTFTDVPQTHPYALQINDMATRHVVDGYGGDLFGPEDWVKRQQFGKMVVLAMEYPVSEADVCPFGDVDVGGPSTFYPDNYVAVAASQGITLGVSPAHFAPWNEITRAQLVTMVARAADLAEPPASYSPTFGNFSATHYPWARRAAYAGLLSGLQGMGPGYDFWAPATRGEVCVVLYNLLHR